MASTATAMAPGARPLMRGRNQVPTHSTNSNFGHICTYYREVLPLARVAQVEASTFAVSSQAPSDTVPELRTVFAPEDMTLEEGEVSAVSVDAREDAESYRCVGCNDAACQGISGCSKTAWRLEEAGYLRSILTARVYDVAVESPLERARLLSKSSGNEVYLKREDLQPVFSFKLRGAFNKMASLPAERLANGVICSSAGNHAQGVALAAQHLGTSAVICMPVSTPEIKVAAVRALSAETRLVGESYTETQAYALHAAEAEGREFVAPYDDPLTIAGQGTVAVEVLKQLGSGADALHAVFVPIGGGGLIAGIAAYVKALRPGVRVIGVEPAGANCMALSLREGRRVQLSKVDAFADGVAVKSVGVETFRLCRRLVDGVVLVDNAAISAAIKDVFSETRSVLEPAGALAVAGAKAYLARHQLQGKTVVAITSGANMNFDRLRLVADLANIGLRTEAMLAVSIPEAPGTFQRFVETLYAESSAVNGSSTVDVTEFKYRYSVDREAQILISLSAPRPADVDAAAARLAAAGYPCRNVTGSKVAQVHLRHMVGGRPRSYSGVIEDERIVVVHFPEKVGALKEFLETLRSSFNVTMFHYRQTGNRSSSALLGIQVPESRNEEYISALASLAPHDYVFDELDAETRELFDMFIS